MHDPDPRPPLLSAWFVRLAKSLLSIFAVLLTVCGGVMTFWVAGVEMYHGLGALLDGQTEETVVFVVRSIDSILLGLVQFLLAAYLWQMLDPNDSLVADLNMMRLEEAKQILCKVVLVIVAVRMLGVLIESRDLKYQDLLFPAAIIALALATSLISGAKKLPPQARPKP